MPDILITSRHPPYGSALARAAIDVALTHAAFDQTVSVLFMDDGVLQLLAAQAANDIEQKNIAKLLQSLTLYDINNVYADANAMHRLGVSEADCALSVKLLGATAMAELMQQHEFVLSF